jgi:TPP-dependent pyruvate/acetoin dehydrogenase alpha subunit
MGDDGRSRPAEEVAYWKEHRDPIKNLGQQLLVEGLLTSLEMDRIHKEAEFEAQEAVRFALESQDTKAESVLDHIYYET